VFLWRPSAAASWTEIADLTRQGIENITRLTVSPDGRWIAIVSQAAAR